MNRIHDLIHY